MSLAAPPTAPHTGRRAVLCLGRTYCDLLFAGLPGMPELGREIFAESLAVAAGGGAYITAAHLVALGRPAELVSRLGRDPLSAAVFAEVTASGVGSRHVEIAADAGPQPTVALIEGSERAFVSRRAGTARPSTLAAALGYPAAGHLHVAEAATLAEIPDLVAAAKAAGLTVSLDPSWDDRLIRDPALLDLAAGVDLFLPNEVELAAITGRDDPADGLDRLADRFPLVVVKLGGAGARLATGDERLSLAAPPVPVVDTTGAGDAFNAGFLDAWLAGAAPTACLAAAVAAGSRAVQKPGGAPPPPGRPDAAPPPQRR
jgi:sugar/nucleoside kinase (ribokinase family)